ncbi:MAG: riboflavin synthase [Zetaproteobacteria bacterium]|nr:MAG: riboflavin synthase [Zetaproteobacteria bacterium]
MFTGIIQGIGRIQARRPLAGGAIALTIDHGLESAGWRPGDSIAVDGCCLTLTGLERAGGRFTVQLSGETLARTTLGARAVGDRVNLEPALRMGDALGGHMVTGHIDGTTMVRAVEPLGDFRRVTVELPDPFAPWIAPKGSVALDGVSLTVNTVERDRFTLSLIPHTLAQTTLKWWRTGTRVNLECDILARYAARQMEWLRRDQAGGPPLAGPAAQQDPPKGASHAGQL